MYTSMITETIEYYNEMGGKPVFLRLLDAKKAFDKVAYDVFLCAQILIVQLLYYNYYMHINQ